MSKVYMECAWFVFDGYDFDEMMRLSHVLECVIWFHPKGYPVYDKGYLLIPVLISADAEEIINIFCDVVYPCARFIQHQLILLTDFQGPRVGTGVSHERYRQLTQGWYAHNKRIEKGLPFWATAFWPVQPISSEDLCEAIKLAETYGIVLHYTTLEHTTEFFTFYFKVSSYHQFDTHLDHIRESLRLGEWHVIRRRLHIQDIEDEEDEDPAFKKEEAAPHLTHKTIPAFLEAIKPYL